MSMSDGKQKRLPTWQRVLLDLHHYTMLAGEGEGFYKFVVYHGDVFAHRIKRYVQTGRAISHLEHSERVRIRLSPFWTTLTKFGYPPVRTDGGMDAIPPCYRNGCPLQRHLLNEAGQVILLGVDSARVVLDMSPYPTFHWLPSRVDVIDTGWTYAEIAAAYLGLEVSNV